MVFRSINIYFAAERLSLRADFFSLTREGTLHAPESRASQPKEILSEEE